MLPTTTMSHPWVLIMSASWHLMSLLLLCGHCDDSCRGVESLNSLALMTRGGGQTLLYVQSMSLYTTTPLFIQQVPSPPGLVLCILPTLTWLSSCLGPRVVQMSYISLMPPRKVFHLMFSFYRVPAISWNLIWVLDVFLFKIPTMNS